MSSGTSTTPPYRRACSTRSPPTTVRAPPCRSAANSARATVGPVALLGALCITALIAVIAAAHQAQAAGDPYAPVTFAPGKGEQVYTVPAGVTMIHLAAAGGRGGPAAVPGQAVTIPGGRGRLLDANMAVTPGQQLYLEVGGAGRPATKLAPGAA